MKRFTINNKKYPQYILCNPKCILIFIRSSVNNCKNKTYYYIMEILWNLFVIAFVELILISERNIC